MTVIRTMQVAVEVLRPSDPAGNDGNCTLAPYTLNTTYTPSSKDGDANLGNPESLDVAFVATPWTLEGTMSNALSLTGDIVIGATALPNTPWTVSAAMTSSGFSAGDVTLPELTLSAVSSQGNTATGDAELPAYDLAGSLEPPLPLPVYTLSGTMISGAVGVGASALRVLRVSGVMSAGTVSNGDLELAAYTLSGGDGKSGDIDLPLYGVDARGVSGAVASGAGLTRAFTLSGSMIQNASADGVINLLPMTVSGTAFSGNVAVGNATLTSLTLNAAAVSGNVGVGQITVPLLRVSAQGYSSTFGTATVVLPLFALDGVMVGTVAAPVFTSMVVNTRTGAVTTYSNQPFNSMCSFAGMVLAASDAGIVALIGDDDSGVAIDAYLTSGVSDFNSAQLKRVSAGYVGGRMDGQLEITMITDEATEYAYRLVPRKVGTIHQARKIFGKGARSRYWQWRLANVDGCGFELDNVSFDYDNLGRRV